LRCSLERNLTGQAPVKFAALFSGEKFNGAGKTSLLMAFSFGLFVNWSNGQIVKKGLNPVTN
jgi:hypothetical protein